MSDNKVKTMWTVAGLILLIVVAATLIARQAVAPKESIKDFSKIPPKGAGQFDRK
jgi:hypothetical protein